MKKTLSLNKRQMESIENLYRPIIETLASDDDEIWEKYDHCMQEFADTGAADELLNISEEALWGLTFAIQVILQASESSSLRNLLDNVREQIGIAGQNGVVISVVKAFE